MIPHHSEKNTDVTGVHQKQHRTGWDLVEGEQCHKKLKNSMGPNNTKISCHIREFLLVLSVVNFFCCNTILFKDSQEYLPLKLVKLKLQDALLLWVPMSSRNCKEYIECSRWTGEAKCSQQTFLVNYQWISEEGPQIYIQQNLDPFLDIPVSISYFTH